MKMCSVVLGSKYGDGWTDVTISVGVLPLHVLQRTHNNLRTLKASTSEFIIHKHLHVFQYKRVFEVFVLYPRFSPCS